MIMEQEFRDSVSALDSLTQASDTLTIPWPADLVRHVAQHHRMFEHMQLLDAWSPLPAAVIKGILDTVRTRILDFVLAIQAENPDAGESAPNAPPPIPATTVSNVFNMTIIGGQANVGNVGPSSIGDSNVASVGNTQAIGQLDDNARALLRELRSQAGDLPADEKGDALDALAKVEAQLAKPKPKLEVVQQYLTLYGTFVTAAAPTIETLMKLLTPLFSR